MKNYMFSLKFEANPIIEAESVEDAEAKAFEMMKEAKVVRDVSQPVRDQWGNGIGVRHVTVDASEYVPQEPYFLEEVKDEDA
jgi:hypothetical protein